MEKVCNQKNKDKFQQNGKFKANGSSEQTNRRVQLVDQEDEDDENIMVLNIEGDENTKPYYMEGLINGNKFKTMIDSGSPVTIFALDEIKQIMKRETLPVREMIEGEKYVDFNGKPLNLLGYVFYELQVGNQYIKKTRILIAKKGTKSIIGREWLFTLRYRFTPVNESELELSSVEKDEELSVEAKQLSNELPDLIKRNGRIKNQQVKINLKSDAKISHQKGRQIPIQLQNAVDAEIKRILKDGHIEKMNEIKDDVFIQPTVITVKKDRSVKIALDARALNQAIDQMPNLDNLPEAKLPNDEISLDFAGPFQNAYKQKKYLLVPVDNNSGWPAAMFLPNPSADKVVEFLLEYIATNGIPKRIRIDPGTVFRGEKLQQFCKERFIQHIICTIRDHRGNGKVERMMRTLNERLRTNRKIVVQNDTSGLSNILFALRPEKGVDNTSAYERQMGRKPNTLKSALIRKCFLEKDPQLQIEPEDFSEEADSTILVRERVKGTKLEGNFKKIKGQIINQNENTITVLPKSGKQTIYSKRDVAKMGQGAYSAKKETAKKKPKIQEKPAKPIQPFWRKLTSSSEMGQIPKTPHRTNATHRTTIRRRKHHTRSRRKRRKPRTNNPNQTVKK